MYEITPIRSVKQEIEIQPDKSISHRALMFSALSAGKTTITNLLRCDDTAATIDCLQKAGVKITFKGKNKVLVAGHGKFFPVSCSRPVRLYTKESGTTIRLMAGIMCGQKFPSRLYAASSLSRRPMRRITIPLRRMGADIKSREEKGEEYPPLRIQPVDSLKGIRYDMPVASAQVKSAILFASLFARGKTAIKESAPSRDHTERMMRIFGGKITQKGSIITVSPSSLRTPGVLFVPGDFSSASFFIVLGLILKDSRLLIKNVGINPTRTGLLRVLKRMGAKIIIRRKSNYFEPFGDIEVFSSHLKGTTVKREEIPLMIDEIPVLIVASLFARGTTKIYGLGELKIKETDRITSMVYNLKQCGFLIAAGKVQGDWVLTVKGPGRRKIDKIKGCRFQSFGDHRTAMSMIVFASATKSTHYIDDVTCINKSFPEFISTMELLKK